MTPCVEWEGPRFPKGYGGIAHKRADGTWTTLGAHRVAWERAHGPIPAGMHVLHRCDNPPCVNVDHLFLGSNDDNIRDRTLKGRSRNQYTVGGVRKTHCKHGHEYTPTSTGITNRGSRYCRICKNERRRKGTL